MVKIVDAIRDHDGPFMSLEYFPPRTDAGLKNLKDRMVRMQRDISPLFCDFTWGAGGSTSELTLELTLTAKRMGLEPNMHLTCTNVKPEQVTGALDACRAADVRNIVALRGDPPLGEEKWEATEGGFSCALDLVKHIRKQYGDYFNISVAGYPEGHPDVIKPVAGGMAALSPSEKRRCRVAVDENGKETVMVCSDADFAKEMAYLKEKVDAGADAIITQMFFDPEVYGDFKQACIQWGINVPVIPGIMCLQAYNGFKKMTKFCKTRVPRELESQVEAAHAVSDEAVRQLGVNMGAEMSRRLLELGAPGLHFYTLNLEKVTYGIIDKLEQAKREERTPSLISKLTSTAFVAATSAASLYILSKLVRPSTA